MSGYIQDAIMLLGDSITEMSTAPFGLCQQLTNVYNRKLDIIVRGFSGYNTAWVLPVFEKVFPKRTERQKLARIQLLTIWFGANDAAFPGEHQHVPLDTFKANLSKLIWMVKDPESEWYSPETHIVLITPPPFLRVNVPRNTLDRNLAGSRTYAEAVKQVAAQESVVVLDIWNLIWEAAGKKEENLTQFLSDGLHLGKEGYKIVYDALIDAIREHYPEIHYDKASMAYPLYDPVLSL
ncbi:uncharacterized protein PHACADRAFT_174060 [Phanerochaete carnosa HHB-10118-sp]|uniref:SGNH hydrolase-type esterase domain-containing protein n=1 Tax=Phanerochaete carnosa (strain HHB-10118-sp) TaxID=650164 RepID=K5W9N6_PHACS|nr:uncharacterized protein PHACADRAFT_174060 [Phanerochaete carnosa HHB-10118-sp]EKM55905.1 hypothetical protein PHACADRAFT_174060 [Phanerochaete carnosa HHB-10118-sp]